MSGTSKKGIHKKKSITAPLTHRSVDQYDDISDLFLSIAGSIATTLHVGSTSSTETIQPIQILTKSKSAFLDKYQAIMKDGDSQLKVVSDFDFTVTKFYIYKPSNRSSIIQTCPIYEPRRISISSHILTASPPSTFTGKTLLQRGISSQRVLDDSNLFSQEYHDQSVSLFQKYYPLEIDPHVAYEKKYQYMSEWTKELHNLLLKKSGMVRNDIENCVRAAIADKRIEVRAKVLEFFEVLSQLNVPLILFTESITEVCEKILDLSFGDSNLVSKSLLLGNRCVFNDADGKLIGFQDPKIHSLNKSASSFLSNPYFRSEEEDQRRNIILIGDNAKDILMISGMKYDALKCLKIGFINENVADKFDSFLDIFDVVIIGDESGFEVPLEIIQNISKIDGNTYFENTVLQEEIRLLSVGTTSAGYNEAFAYDAATGYEVSHGFEATTEADCGYDVY